MGVRWSGEEGMNLSFRVWFEDVVWGDGVSGVGGGVAVLIGREHACVAVCLRRRRRRGVVGGGVGGALLVGGVFFVVEGAEVGDGEEVLA